MIVLPYLISYLIGSLTILSVIKNSEHRYTFLHFLLSWGIGLGLSSLLTFLAYLLAGIYYRGLIIFLNLFVLLILLAVNFSYLRSQCHKNKLTLSFKTLFTPFNLFMTIFWIAIFIVICVFASFHPFGEWDAWGMWNLKTNFLVLSHQPWVDIFQNLHWYTHRDYPLLLPFIHVWIYSFGEKHLNVIPMINSLVLTMGCGLLLYAGCKTFLKKEYAFLVSCLLFTQPYYLFMATAQYADILLAFYLLSSLITLLFVHQQKFPKLAFLPGLLLGLLSFSKNEGLVMSILIAGITLIYWHFENGSDKTLKRTMAISLLLGLFIAGLPTIIFKLYMAPPNLDILPNLTMGNTRSFNANKAVIIATYILIEILHKKWCFIWVLCLILFFTRIRQFFLKEAKIFSLFFILYFCTVLMIYFSSTTSELKWWIPYSLPRIYFTILPSALFFCFYNHWRISKAAAPSSKPK